MLTHCKNATTENEQLAAPTLRDVVPIRPKKVKVSLLDELKELRLPAVGTAEWWKTTQQDVEDHS